MADTYAIVESGGKQYKVEKGETLLLDRLPAKQGEKVDLRAVMFRDSDVVTDPAELEKVKVEATVSEHLRGPKIRIFKYKAKKGYRRRAGHRSELTRVEITDLKKLARTPAAKKPQAKAETKAEEPKAEAAAKPATRKTTKGKTRATRKTTAKKSPARKSTTRKTSTRKTSGSSSTKKGSSSGS
jgi:large subunit ribosomal protein L21